MELAGRAVLVTVRSDKFGPDLSLGADLKFSGTWDLDEAAEIFLRLPLRRFQDTFWTHEGVPRLAGVIDGLKVATTFEAHVIQIQELVDANGEEPVPPELVFDGTVSKFEATFVVGPALRLVFTVNATELHGPLIGELCELQKCEVDLGIRPLQAELDLDSEPEGTP